jgi:vacuolar-type H+-ATPase subunit C/Vma6
MSAADFTAAASRARGLATHLLPRAELEKLLASEASLLPRGLARSGRLSGPLGEDASPGEIETALRQTARQAMAVLGRWEGAAPVLEVFAADQDRRSIRALLRGALQAAPAEQRLAGLLPTATLPERGLRELALQPTPAAVVAHLFALGHPDAPRLLPLTARKAQPELAALELALLQGFAERTRRALERADATLRAFVALRLDLANVQAALLLAGEPEPEALRTFVEGGAALGKEAFLQAASATSPGVASRLLTSERRGSAGGTAFTASAVEGSARGSRRRTGGGARGSLGVGGNTAVGRLLRESTDLATLERRGFCLCLEEARRAARVQPLGSGPVIDFLLRLEAMARDVRRLAWAAAQHAPAAFVRPELVTR